MNEDISAFPDPARSADATIYFDTGMTLGDYFAAKAMQSFLRDVGCMVDENHFDLISRASYKVADAMLKERNK